MARRAANLVVKQHRPVRSRVLGIVLAVSLVAGAYGLFEYGRMRGGYDLLASRNALAERDKEIATLNREIEQMRDSIALLQTSRGIDSEAYQQIEARLQVLQGTIQEQTEDLAFYKGIISPEDGQSGLKIRKFSVRPVASEGHYVLEVVLIQAKQHDRRVSGVVQLTVDGTRNGQPESLDIKDLRVGEERQGELAYSFRYFQDLEEEVALPAGFTPERVSIEVRPTGRSARSIREDFPWKPLVAQGS